MFTIDAHLDLAMNAMEWNRDLTQPVFSIRQREHGLTDKPDRSMGTVSFPELRKGNVGLVVATQIARYVAPDNFLPGWHSPAQAWAHTQAQRAWYEEMVHQGQLTLIDSLAKLDRHVELWTNSQDVTPLPIGYIMSLEGADSLVDPSYAETAFRYGLRAIGPAHYGPGRYAQGTDASGNLTPMGVELLKVMEHLHMILDVTHLCDESFWDALDRFKGPVWASHNNCRSLVPHHRQFSDDQIKELIRRDAVIGGVMDAWMLVPDWQRGISTPSASGVSLQTLIEHMDHICQLAGNANHIGIGSDLDGAFGKEQSPADIETIADLQTIPSLLARRGYTTADIENVMHGNWLRFLRKNWVGLPD
ncbi:MAG: membrane dipeptidase [Cyclobacteriaceae bacterium]